MNRSDIVRSRPSFYNEANLHADTEVCLEFLEHNDYGFAHQVLAHQRLRPGLRAGSSVKASPGDVRFAAACLIRSRRT